MLSSLRYHPVAKLWRCVTISSLFGLSFCVPAHTQTSSSARLPNAPSVTLYTKDVIVNGRPYHKPSAHDDLRAYRQEIIGTRAFVSAGIRGAIEQSRPVPIGWGQDFPGYTQRYGSAYGESAIDSSVRFGLAGLLHEDVRYLSCHKCSLGNKFENAFLAEFTARHGEDGHRSFSVTPIVAGFSGPLVAYSAWYPAGYGPEDAAKHSVLGFGTRIVFHLVREVFFDRDK
jgi:hypothetical protein